MGGGIIMGRMTADALTELNISLQQQIEIHLRGNFYPPVPLSMVQPCLDAIEAYYDENSDKEIAMPKGISYKGSNVAPAWAIIEEHRLDSWLEGEEN